MREIGQSRERDRDGHRVTSGSGSVIPVLDPRTRPDPRTHPEPRAGIILLPDPRPERGSPRVTVDFNIFYQIKFYVFLIRF